MAESSHQQEERVPPTATTRQTMQQDSLEHWLDRFSYYFPCDAPPRTGPIRAPKPFVIGNSEVYPYPPPKNCYSGEEYGDVIEWSRRTIQLALAQRWPQGELVVRASDLLYGNAARFGRRFRQMCKEEGVKPFWKFLRFLITRYGGPLANDRDCFPRWHTATGVWQHFQTVELERMTKQLFGPFPVSHSRLVTVPRFERKVEQKFLDDYDNYIRDMHHMFSVLSCPPFVD